MKTFDEAIAAVTVKRNANLSLQEICQTDIPPELREHFDRYHSLAQEISRHDAVADLIAQLLYRTEIGQVLIENAVLEAFCHGVIVGIEMEKQECEPSSL